MINDIIQDAQVRMDKSIDALKNELKKVRTGRAHPSILDQVTVPYYGSDVPLSQVANVSVSDARTLAIEPWEKPMVSVIEKAIIDSGLGLNPATNSDKIRIPLPPLTEERRRDLAKMVRSEVEGGRVAVRNIRRDANQTVKQFLKDKDISEDDAKRAEEQIQKLTDACIKQMDLVSEEKEKELMAV